MEQYLSPHNMYNYFSTFFFAIPQSVLSAAVASQGLDPQYIDPVVVTKKVIEGGSRFFLEIPEESWGNFRKLPRKFPIELRNAWRYAEMFFWSR